MYSGRVMDMVIYRWQKKKKIDTEVLKKSSPPRRDVRRFVSFGMINELRIEIFGDLPDKRYRQTDDPLCVERWEGA
jgi:hypothetical protein